MRRISLATDQIGSTQHEAHGTTDDVDREEEVVEDFGHGRMRNYE